MVILLCWSLGGRDLIDRFGCGDGGGEGTIAFYVEIAQRSEAANVASGTMNKKRDIHSNKTSMSNEAKSMTQLPPKI